MITTKKGNSVELLKELESNSIDLLVTDPPYKVATGGVPCRKVLSERKTC